MSQKGSVFQKGGGGTNFEQLVQTAFLTTLIIHGNAPCLDSGELSEVALQVTNRGYETDDFMVTAKSASGEHRILIQVKHDISFTVDNEIFKEVINAFWKDYNNTSIFDKSKDKLIIVKNGLTKDERNHLKSLFNWAKNHATEADFITEVNRIRGKKDRLDVFREVLKEANNNTYLTDKELWEFLKCVDVLEYDFLNEGSIDKTYFLNLIKLSKNKNSAATEKEIWDSIFAYVATLNPNGGSVTLESIRDKDFFQHFDNTHLTPYFKAVEKLKSDSNEILRPIKTYIGKGENKFHLQRSELREKILVGLSNSQLTIVTGKPGVGKSAEIKETLEKDYPNASVFVFRADQFNESTLANVFSSGKDVIWKKNLIEMDIRNYKVGEYDEKLGGFPIQPEYDNEVVKFIESNKESFEADTKSLNILGQLSKTYEKKEIIDFSSWLSCYEQYSSSKSLNILYDRPITLAVLGLRDFATNINEEQKTKCIKIITDATTSILQDTFSRGYGLNMSISIMEKEIALSSFHLLMENVDSEEDKNGIIATMIYMLFAPFHDHEFDKIIQYFREVFFKQFPNEAKRVWLGLIKYACYKKANPNFYGNQDEKSLKKENDFVQKIASNKNLKLDLAEISLEKSEGYLLARAFVITPYDTADKDFTYFINHILPIVLGDLAKEEDYSYNRGRESRQFHHESISDIEQYLANLFLDANFDFSKSVLTTLVNSLLKNTQRQRFERDDLFQFVNTTLDYFVLKLYDNGNLKIDQTKYSQQQTNFWNLWEVLFDLIPSDGTHPLIQKLLLDIRYLLWDYQGNPNENDWSVLNGKKEFYKKVFLEKGKNNTSSVMNVFSTIGGKDFLPEGISWLVDVFKSNPMTSLSLTSVSSERMIKRLFYNHISKIKNDKTLIDDYVWILNRMVDLGSSEAYLFRENVIIYKSTGVYQ